MEDILHNYSVLKGFKPPRPFGDGHINDTFLVKSGEGKFVLQRVNNKIFNTSVLIRNLSFLFKALIDYEKMSGKKLTPTVLKNNYGEFHTLDKAGAAWRLMKFFPGCNTYTFSPDEEMSYRAARAVGEFQLFLNILPAKNFSETITGFHNTPARLKTFLKTVSSAPAILKKQALTPSCPDNMSCTTLATWYERLPVRPKKMNRMLPNPGYG